VTPTATATLTPTPPVSARLEKGRWLQSIGNCAEARREFADLIATHPDPNSKQGTLEVAEARYRLAQCYLRDDAPAEGSAVLSQLLAIAPEGSPYRTPAFLLRGEALARLGLWAEAEASYQAALPLAPELSSLLWQRIGGVRWAAGDLPGATQAYSAALKTAPDWSTTVAIRRNLAELARAQGDYRAAVSQYDLLRGTATTGAWAAEMQWLAGSALAEAGDMASAKRRWQAAVDADPTTTYAHKALVALLDAGVTVDECQRGVVDYHNGLYQLAIAAFDRCLAADPTGRAGAAWYYKGLSYLALGQTHRGIAELDHLIATYPDSPHWSNAWLAKARSQARAGQTEAAIATYREFVRRRPFAPQAPTALWQAANLQEQAGELKLAAEAYLALARCYPTADEAWRAYQAAGLIYFRLGDWDRAAQVWAEMAGEQVQPNEALSGTVGAGHSLPAWTRPVAYFWLGRAQAAAGQPDAARRSWQAAIESGPATYYGLRAADWIARLEGTQLDKTSLHQQSSRPEDGSAKDEVQLASWLRTWAGNGSLELPRAVLEDADWRRGQILMTVGWRTEGLAAWGNVQRRHAEEPWTLAALALAFRDAGAYRLSILSAEQLARLWPGGELPEAPPALQRLAYPMAYAPLLREQAARWGLDARLLAAVIRQESLFEVAATSRAGAQGLMQVMPGTAQGIAAQLNWPDFRAEQAYWPYINVAFGAYYIHQGLTRFDGSLAAALAAYNGGPGNAMTWRQLAPDDDDLMVALININETRAYVQAVWVHYDYYRRLYQQ